MNYKFWLALAVTAPFNSLPVNALGAHAIPPRYPEGCAVTKGTLEKRSVTFGRSRKGVESKVTFCYTVGAFCKNDEDCEKSQKKNNICTPKDGKSPDSDILDVDTFTFGDTTNVHCIDGTCRAPEQSVPNGPCNCLQGCHFKDNDGRDQTCIAGKCKAAPCAACGQKKGNMACCGRGVLDHDGETCYCSTGVGEGCGVDRKKCSAGDKNDICCGKGTDNEGFCCAVGSCDGECKHAFDL